MATTSVAPQRRDAPLSSEELGRLDGWWRAANYLSVGQIYLLDNPLLREPLTLEHVKPRLLGHWGTTPGLNLLYAHMNRAIMQRDLDAMFITPTAACCCPTCGFPTSATTPSTFLRRGTGRARRCACSGCTCATSCR